MKMSCIIKMSPIPVADIQGLSHLYLLAKIVLDVLTVRINN